MRVELVTRSAGRLDKVLAEVAPEGLSRSRLRGLIEAGAVFGASGAMRNPSAKVGAGVALVLDVPPLEEAAPEPQDIPLDVAFEDDALIVVNKPAGMVVHPAPGAPDGTLVNALLHHCGESLSGIGGERRPGIVHRIDKDTSGLLVVAKTDVAHHHLSAQFAAHTVERSYLAVCQGVPDRATPRLARAEGVGFEPGGVIVIRTQIGRHPRDRLRMAVLAQGGRHAVTRVRVLEPLGGATLVECRLETGRTHQIRVHMAHLGHPLLGDATYGGRGTGAAIARQALHAATLGFEHPDGTDLRFSAPVPEDINTLLTTLKSGTD
ncbi:MAG: RluA family pseudouridine synthase [Pseudomonadota bacterium]